MTKYAYNRQRLLFYRDNHRLLFAFRHIYGTSGSVSLNMNLYFAFVQRPVQALQVAESGRSPIHSDLPVMLGLNPSTKKRNSNVIFCLKELVFDLLISFTVENVLVDTVHG